MSFAGIKKAYYTLVSECGSNNYKVSMKRTSF